MLFVLKHLCVFCFIVMSCGWCPKNNPVDGRLLEQTKGGAGYKVVASVVYSRA